MGRMDVEIFLFKDGRTTIVLYPISVNVSLLIKYLIFNLLMVLLYSLLSKYEKKFED